LSIYCTQLVHWRDQTRIAYVASRLLAGLVTVEQASTTASFARKRDARKRLARDRDQTASMEWLVSTFFRF